MSRVGDLYIELQSCPKSIQHYVEGMSEELSKLRAENARLAADCRTQTDELMARSETMAQLYRDILAQREALGLLHHEFDPGDVRWWIK